jgi:hypothetical protein
LPIETVWFVSLNEKFGRALASEGRPKPVVHAPRSFRLAVRSRHRWMLGKFWPYLPSFR